MRFSNTASRVLATSVFSVLLLSVTTSRLEAGNLGRPAMVFSPAHFNAGIGGHPSVRTTSPIVVHVHPVNPVQVKPFVNPESDHLYDPLNNNPILNPPAQHLTSGLQTPSQAVRSSPVGPTIETATRTAVAGYSVPEVRQVQTALRRLGYYRGNVDGDFGENTQTAIEKYQLSAGEPVTGTLDQGVLSRLGVATR